MEGECRIESGSAHIARWCTTHTSLLETCQLRRIDALEAEVRRLREALGEIVEHDLPNDFNRDDLVKDLKYVAREALKDSSEGGR